MSFKLVSFLHLLIIMRAKELSLAVVHFTWLCSERMSKISLAVLTVYLCVMDGRTDRQTYGTAISILHVCIHSKCGHAVKTWIILHF